MSEPEPENFFTPVKKIALVLCNSRYDQLRQKENFGGFCDLEDCAQDLVTFKNGLKNYGFGRRDITCEEDVDYNGLKELMDSLRVELINNGKSKIKTLLVIYYAGHGCMRGNTTQVVLNDQAKTFYPMESIARVFAEIQGAYVMVIFDCCRENLNNAKYRSGGGETEQESDPASYRNLILINGCPPNREVDAKSSIAAEFFT